MENLGGTRSSPQQYETLNGIEKLKWLARKFEESKCTTEDDKIEVGILPETPAPNVIYHGCRGNWSPRRRQHRRFKQDVKQRYLPLEDNALPPLFFPSFTQQNDNIGPVITAAEVLPRPNATLKSDWRPACAAGSKSSTSISPTPNTEPETAATSLILPVLQELHRLKTIINAHNREKEHNCVRSLSEDAGGVQTSEEMSGSEDSHINGEIRAGGCGVSNALTESEDVVTATEYSGEQDNAVSDIFRRRVEIEDPSGQGKSDYRKEEHVFSLKGVPGNSNEDVCETRKRFVELRESPSPKWDPPPLPISRIRHGEDHESPSSPPTRIHVGINPFYQRGFQPLKLFEVRNFFKQGRANGN